MLKIGHETNFQIAFPLLVNAMKVASYVRKVSSLSIFRKSAKEIQVSLESDENNWYVT
jgi:hypothetical protein